MGKNKNTKQNKGKFSNSKVKSYSENRDNKNAVIRESELK